MGKRWNDLCIFLLNMIMLNILWLLTVIAGLIIFGIGPANYALSATIRQWLKEGSLTSPARHYLKYLRETVAENILSGVTMILIIVVIATDLLVIDQFFFRIIFIVASIVSLPVILLYYPISAHFNVSSIQEKIHLIYQIFIRYGLTMVLSLCVIGIYIMGMLRFLPAYFILVGVASIQYFIMWSLKKILIKENVWEF